MSSRYCHSCGEPLDGTDRGWVHAVREDPSPGVPSFLDDRPVALHVDCRDRLHSIGTIYRALDAPSPDPEEGSNEGASEG